HAQQRGGGVGAVGTQQIVAIRGHRDRGQDGQHHHHDHELDQCHALHGLFHEPHPQLAPDSRQNVLIRERKLVHAPSTSAPDRQITGSFLRRFGSSSLPSSPSSGSPSPSSPPPGLVVGSRPGKRKAISGAMPPW